MVEINVHNCGDYERPKLIIQKVMPKLLSWCRKNEKNLILLFLAGNVESNDLYIEITSYVREAINLH